MKRILVSDDDNHVLQYLKRILEREGHDVVTASDGNKGIRLMHAEPVDLVITDILMPNKDGIETILELQRDMPDVKVIAISGGGRIGAQYALKIATKFGADRTFPKPFTRDELLNAVQELLSAPIPA